MEKKRFIKDTYRSTTRYKSFNVDIKLTGSKGPRNDYPIVKIKINSRIYFEDTIENEKNIHFLVDDKNVKQVLSLEMTRKTPKDTLIENGKIIKDKAVYIKEIKIDGVRIRKYLYTARQTPKYHEADQGLKEIWTDSLHFQGEWKLHFENPPIPYFANYFYEQAFINKNPTDSLLRLRSYVELMEVHYQDGERFKDENVIDIVNPKYNDN